MDKQHMTPQEQYQYHDAIFGEHARQALDDIELADELTEKMDGIQTALISRLEMILDNYDLEEEGLYSEIEQLLEMVEEL